jgi:hypothetical protein
MRTAKVTNERRRAQPRRGSCTKIAATVTSCCPPAHLPQRRAGRRQTAAARSPPPRPRRRSLHGTIRDTRREKHTQQRSGAKEGVKARSLITGKAVWTLAQSHSAFFRFDGSKRCEQVDAMNGPLTLRQLGVRLERRCTRIASDDMVSTVATGRQQLSHLPGFHR